MEGSSTCSGSGYLIRFNDITHNLKPMNERMVRKVCVAVVLWEAVFIAGLMLARIY